MFDLNPISMNVLNVNSMNGDVMFKKFFELASTLDIPTDPIRVHCRCVRILLECKVSVF